MDGMGEFNSNDHYIYYCGEEYLGRNGIALKINKRIWNAILGCKLKNSRMISIHFWGKPFKIIVIPTTDTGETEVDRFYEDLQQILELTPKKDVHRGLEWKSRKSRNTHNNRNVSPWSTKWSRAKANRVLSREYSEQQNPFPTTQETTLHKDITRESILKSDWFCSLQPKMEKLHTVSKNKTQSSLWLRSWAPFYNGYFNILRLPTHEDRILLFI